MASPLSTRAALVLALRHGPGYGQELVKRVERLSGGALRISEPHAYLALKTLRARGLVERWDVVPGGARGARRRAYYGLTSPGLDAARRLQATVLGIAGGDDAAPPPVAAKRRMADRLLAGDALNAFGSALRRAMTGLEH